ncbi:MAG: hypothetical protein WD830_08210 [Chloroflexota bacterium]
MSLRLGGTALIALAITAVVVVATLVILLAGNPPAAAYPADSAEGAFQRYLGAWYDEDYDTAHTYFSARIKAQMSLAQYRQDSEYGYGPDNQSVELDSVTGTDERKNLRLTVIDYFGFGGEGYSRTESVPMVLEPDGWRIDRALLGMQEHYDFSEF